MPGALAKALSRNPNPLQDIGNAVSAYLKRVDEQRNQKALLDEITNMNKDIQSYYQPRTEMQAVYRDKPSPLAMKLQGSINNNLTPQLTLSNPNANVGLRSLGQQPTFEERQVPVNMADANRQANDRKVSFLLNALKNNIPQEKVNQGMSIADALIQNRQPVRPNRVRLKKGEQLYNEDPYTGALSFERENPEDLRPAEPKFAKSVDEITTSDNKRYKQWQDPNTGETYWTNQSGTRLTSEEAAKLSAKDTRPVTNINMPKDYSRLIGNVNEGIKKLKDIKNTKFLPIEEVVKQGLVNASDYKNDKGQYTVGGFYKITDSSGNNKLMSQDELNAYKEQTKNSYVNDSVQMITEQGLNPVVEEIRKGVQRGMKPKDAMNAFKKANPDLSAEDERIVKDYFDLMTE